ncbi:helix-turn-helix domain-containing protein [Streptomyces sp. NPDC059070]|uniref:helix-turn-helix domain-containing protein n=1 Tax=Streptomyces sp. NPDC059070 TaxID=3346713 RepID=UPI0036A9BC9B
MTAAHMGLVFAAHGLGGAEKLLLLAYCNRTDDHGYCWPGQKRLADDCGTSLATVKRVKRSLTDKGLISSVRRVHPVTGDPITNLTRVNLALLEKMARPRAAYDDNAVEQLTFPDDAPPPTKRHRASAKQGRPRATYDVPPDLLTAHGEPDQGSPWAQPRFSMGPALAQAEPPSLIDPSKTPPLPPPPVETENPSTARETSTAGANGANRQGRSDAEAIAALWTGERAAHGLVTMQPRQQAYATEAAALLAQGVPSKELHRLAQEMAQHAQWFSLVKHLEASQQTRPTEAPDQPVPGARSLADHAPIPDPCPHHRHRSAADCVPCRSGHEDARPLVKKRTNASADVVASVRALLRKNSAGRYGARDGFAATDPSVPDTLFGGETNQR